MIKKLLFIHRQYGKKTKLVPSKMRSSGLRLLGPFLILFISACSTDSPDDSETQVPSDPVTNVAPTGQVTISGTLTVGATLTAGSTLADDNGLGEFSYQWFNNGEPISGATGSIYQSVEADAGAEITLTISYTDADGFNESITSSGVFIEEMTVVKSNVAPTGQVTISGTLTVGETLTAGSTLADENGLGEFSYQWFKNSEPISGATGSIYQTVEADAGAEITLTISYTDADGFNESITSSGVFIEEIVIAQSLPNILFIISDDQGIDASAQYDYSSAPPITPTINDVAENGLVFENVWATPACTTTRAALLTGKHGVNSGVDYVPAEMDSSLSTLPRYLKTLADYQTAAFGKWHVGGGNSDEDHPTDSGFDHYAGNLSNVDDFYDWSLVENGVSSDVTEYHTSKITDLVIDWVAQQNASNTPWFSWVAYSAPHTPLHLPPSDLHTRSALTGTDTDISDNPREYLLAAIEAMDSEIGRLLDSMSQSERDNTLIIYIGDNGTSARTRDTAVFSRTSSKGTLSEGGIRVPLVIQGAGVSRMDEREAGLINVTDFYATLGEYVASFDDTLNAVSALYDSISFSQSFITTNQVAREYNYSEFVSDDVTGWTVLSDGLKLIELTSGEQYLYAASDLDQTQNLINDSQYSSEIAELAQIAAMVRGEANTAAPLDITDAILTSRSANCEDYVESYESNVLDVARSMVFEGDLKIDVTGDKCVFSTNMIPNHDFNDGGNAFPNEVSAQDVQFEVTKTPTAAAQSTALSLTVDNAIMLNGVKVDLLAAACFGIGNEKVGCNDIDQPWRFDPMFAANGFRVDSHNAHSQADGSYHYHGSPNALFHDDDDSAESPVVGFAADGFPIFGSYFDDNGTIRKAVSSYQLRQGTRPSGDGEPGGSYDGTYRDDYEYVAESGDLDACNGMTLNGVYGYFITEGYPYVMACFTGTPDPTFNK